jgi:NAD(P)-dependent dehydrogenase (short-subunit alcohol dehydrogenase family)
MSTESVSAPVGLVTGADKGIGLERAGRLAGAGYRAYLTAHSTGGGRAAAATAGAQFLELDVTSDKSVFHAAGCAGRAGGHLDVLVNNAGITGRCVRPARLHRRQTHRRSGRAFSPAAKAALHARDQGRPITSTGGGDHCDNWNTGS